jgi:hypothetical protein
MCHIHDAEVLAVYDLLKDKYPLTLTTTTDLNEGFTIDSALIIGKAHGQIMELYQDGAFVMDVMDEAQTQGTHWHPSDIEEAANDIAAFMEGKQENNLVPFR